MFPRDRRQPTQAGQGRGRRGLKISLLSPPAHGGERAEGPGSQPGRLFSGKKKTSGNPVSREKELRANRQNHQKSQKRGENPKTGPGTADYDL